MPLPLTPVRSASPFPWVWPRWLITALILGVVGVVAWAHAVVLAPFIMSMALAYVLEPSVEWMASRGLPRPVGAALSLLGVMLLALLLVTLLVPIVVDLAPKLQAQLPDLAASIWHAVSPRLAVLGIKVPAELTDLKPVLIKLFNTHGEQWMQASMSYLRVGGSWVMTFLGVTILVPVLAFYWLLDWFRLVRRARELMPQRWRPRADVLLAEVDQVLGHYLRGQLAVMLTLAVYYSVGLMLFGFDLALPIGVFTGLAVFIPYLGFGLGLMLALLSGTLQFFVDPSGSWLPLIAVALVYGLGQVLESFVLTPRLVGGRIGLHPAGVILALMLFGTWFGFVGVLMALPLSALIMVLLRHAMVRYKASAFYLQGRS